jgi:hypothetical protein
MFAVLRRTGLGYRARIRPTSKRTSPPSSDCWIVWVHAGWDLTGERTVPHMRSLLRAALCGARTGPTVT